VTGGEMTMGRNDWIPEGAALVDRTRDTSKM